jgi:hypothetical protein
VTDDADDLEECWREIRPQPNVQIITTQPSRLRDALELACETTAFDLAQECRDLHGKLLTPEDLGTIVSKAVRLFMTRWYEGLRSQNLAGLIEIVLEGQDLSPSEMTAFVRALPTKLIEKIADSAVGSGTGVHGLMGVEHARRNGALRDYSIGRDPGSDNRVYVRFRRGDRDVEFFLDEHFELS